MEARRAPRKKGRGEERSDFYAALVLWYTALAALVRVWYTDVAIKGGVVYWVWRLKVV
jgi:hypothetical protein